MPFSSAYLFPLWVTYASCCSSTELRAYSLPPCKKGRVSYPASSVSYYRLLPYRISPIIYLL